MTVLHVALTVVLGPESGLDYLIWGHSLASTVLYVALTIVLEPKSVLDCLI